MTQCMLLLKCGYMLMKNQHMLKNFNQNSSNYNDVLSISSKLLEDYNLGKKRRVPKLVLTKLSNF